MTINRLIINHILIFIIIIISYIYLMMIMKCEDLELLIEQFKIIEKSAAILISIRQ